MKRPVRTAIVATVGVLTLSAVAVASYVVWSFGEVFAGSVQPTPAGRVTSIAEGVVGGPVDAFDAGAALQYRAAGVPDGIYYIPMPTGSLDGLALVASGPETDLVVADVAETFGVAVPGAGYRAVETWLEAPFVNVWAIVPDDGAPFLFVRDF